MDNVVLKRLETVLCCVVVKLFEETAQATGRLVTLARKHSNILSVGVTFD